MGILFPKTHTYTLKTYTTGEYVTGRYIEGQLDIKTIEADIQPMTDKEVEAMNIGRKNLGKIKIYISTQLKIANETTKQNGDIITWNGEDYELISEDIRDNNLINHYKYIGEIRKRPRENNLDGY